MHHYYIYTYKILLALALALVATGCADTEEYPGEAQSGNVINVGGIDTDNMLATSSVSTRSDVGIGNVDPTGAENEKWLIQPLKNGFDITYGTFLNNTKGTPHVAILKLLGGTLDDYEYDKSTYGYAKYSFKYRSDTDGTPTNEDAIWYDNGPHYFEGFHVPARIRYTDDVSELETEHTIDGKTVAAAHNLTTEQWDASDTGTDDQLGNYTLLSHYLSMPASTHISATISRIKLPFQHRLARVLVYVLIDPSLGATTKLEGYSYSETVDAEGKTIITPDDPKTTGFRFNNVEVLEGVKDIYNETKKIHTLTPQWTKARKIIPHFVNEDGTRDPAGNLIKGFEKNFVMYTNIDKKENIFGTDQQNRWSSINKNYTDKYNSTEGTVAEKVAAAEKATGYHRTEYGTVPLYDIIVRPTYTKIDNVMYDEDLTDTTPQALVSHKNSIDFTLKLNTGLQYEKHFDFDLDANYQTAVYLVINREEINYNTSGAEKWITQSDNDDWYGLDNENGNTLSLAGNSWQRAYTWSASANDIDADGADKVTDGGFYNETTTGEDGTKGQYLNKATWKEYFTQAYKGGTHHGDYFILTSDITINADEFPIDFVFTGHLDARDHTITLEGTDEWVTCANEVLSKLKQKNVDGEGLETYTPVPQLYRMKEIAQAPPRTLTGSIPAGTPVEIPMSKTLPARLTELTDDGEIILYKDGEEYKVYNNRTFYKKTAGSLFDGIDGSYTTNQESADPKKDSEGYVIWEANVHKETNANGTRWVPTTGWRAEVLNTRIKKGSLLPADYAYPNSGNVRNCYDVNEYGEKVKAYNNTPELPRYK